MSASHSGAAASDDGQPNLVPLLDLVMQLVMFFMMCANFAMAQVDQTVMLPVAQAAKPMSDTGSDVVFLNVNAEGQLIVVGRPEPLQGEEAITGYLQTIAEEARRRKPGNADAPIDTLVIVRAHRDVNYVGVYKVLLKCQELGLRKLQLRAHMVGK